jgi:hypothetical protein
MVNKRFWLGMLVMVLVFGMTVVGCDTNPTEESDTWSNVTSLNQMDGTWKCSYGQYDGLMKDIIEEQGGTWTSEAQALYGDMRISSLMEITITINSNAGTRSMNMTITTTYSGGNINTAWSTIKEAGQGLDGVVLNDANHSVTMTSNSPPVTLSNEDIAGSGAQINQNGTKAKAPANALVQGSPELIFIKQ